MAGDFIASISLAAAFIAITITFWQALLTRQALKAQAYTNLESIESESKFREGMQAIAELKEYEGYDQYVHDIDGTQRQCIYNTVSYLNFIAHLVDEGFLSEAQAWRLYRPGYLLCHEKLLDWWLVGIRKKRPKLFTYFERMCLAAANGKGRNIEKRIERKIKKLKAAKRKVDTS